MTHLVRRCLIGGGLVGLSACGGESPERRLTEQDLASIVALHQRFIAAALSGNADSLLALYTVDAVVMPPNVPSVEGRDAIRRWFTEGPTFSALTLEIVEVDGHEDLAFVRGRYTLTMTPPGARRAVADTGKFLEVRHRMPDGQWLLTVDMFSSNRPAP